MVGKTFLNNETFVSLGQDGLHSSGGLAHEWLNWSNFTGFVQQHGVFFSERLRFQGEWRV